MPDRPYQYRLEVPLNEAMMAVCAGYGIDKSRLFREAVLSGQREARYRHWLAVQEVVTGATSAAMSLRDVGDIAGGLGVDAALFFDVARRLDRLRPAELTMRDLVGIRRAMPKTSNTVRLSPDDREALHKRAIELGWRRSGKAARTLLRLDPRIMEVMGGAPFQGRRWIRDLPIELGKLEAVGLDARFQRGGATPPGGPLDAARLTETLRDAEAVVARLDEAFGHPVGAGAAAGAPAPSGKRRPSRNAGAGPLRAEAEAPRRHVRK